VPCRLSICNECGFDDHRSHFLINKSNFQLERNSIDKAFAAIENDLTSDELFVDTSTVKEFLAKYIENHIDSLHDKLNIIKDLKLKEMNSIFNNCDDNVQILKKNINVIKTSILQFFEGHKNFLSWGKYNNDVENSIFLVIFEMMNICLQKNNEIRLITNKIKDDYANYQLEIKEKTETIMKIMDEMINEEVLGKVKDTINIEKINFNLSYGKLSEDFYKDVKQRIKKYSDHIDKFRKTVFDTVKRDGSYEEINKIIELFDNKNKNGIEYIFGQEIPGTDEFTDDPNMKTTPNKKRNLSKSKLKNSCKCIF
jgi:hypothetical protein